MGGLGNRGGTDRRRAPPAGLSGLEFALTALCTVLAIDAFRINRDLPAPAIAFVCGSVALVLAKDVMLPVALGLFVLALIVRYIYRNRVSRA